MQQSPGQFYHGAGLSSQQWQKPPQPQMQQQQQRMPQQQRPSNFQRTPVPPPVSQQKEASHAVLFSAANCQHCTRAMQMLRNTPASHFVRVADVAKIPRERLPSFLTHVPTLYIPSENRQLTGEQLFQWISFQNQHVNRHMQQCQASGNSQCAMPAAAPFSAAAAAPGNGNGSNSGYMRNAVPSGPDSGLPAPFDFAGMQKPSETAADPDELPAFDSVTAFAGAAIDNFDIECEGEGCAIYSNIDYSPGNAIPPPRVQNTQAPSMQQRIQQNQQSHDQRYQMRTPEQQISSLTPQINYYPMSSTGQQPMNLVPNRTMTTSSATLPEPIDTKTSGSEAELDKAVEAYMQESAAIYGNNSIAP